MRTRITRRYRSQLPWCILTIGAQVLLVACGNPVVHPAILVTPTLIPMATTSLSASPTPSAPLTPNPIVRRNRSQGCAPEPPPSAPNVISNARYPGWAGLPPREVALTFDDGPSPASTPAILTFLERSRTPATFFLIGQQVQQWRSLVQREWRDGFALGNHTWNHPDMTRQTVAGMRFELSTGQQALRAAISSQACLWLWRPPYDDYNGTVLRVARGLGLSTVTWSVDPRDWSRPGTGVIVARVLAQVYPGAIILLHDGGGSREQTLAALPRILAGLRARGLVPVTLPKLLADGHYPGVAEA
jgi:peptidoglycan-N-acetylglucosamine deacetylase